jgi:hypothetical protein
MLIVVAFPCKGWKSKHDVKVFLCAVLTDISVDVQLKTSNHPDLQEYTVCTR